MKAPYRGRWIGPECRKAASLEAIRAAAFSGGSLSGNEDQVPPGSVRWPWPPNYTFARPDDRPYRLEEVLPRFAPGWRALIREAFEMAAGRHVVQVEEKFGRLRVYLATGDNDPTYVAWEIANSVRSLATCSVCGAIDASVSTAATASRGHVETLCGPCRAEREAGEADPARVRAMWRAAAERARQEEAAAADDPPDEGRFDADLIADLGRASGDDEFASSPDEETHREAIRERLAEKLHPSRFTAMSGKMAALTAFVLGERWTSPDLTEVVVTSDGMMLGQRRGTVGANDWIGSEADYRRNTLRLIEVAGLTEDEVVEFGRLQRRRITRFG